MGRPHAVVTGGAGFVGSHLCERLVLDGWRVTCVDNLCTGSERNVELLLESPAFDLVHADVSRGLPVRQGDVDVVMHLACPASPVHYGRLPRATLRTCADGTWNAVALAEERGARLVLASTSEVYGEPVEHPQREEYRGNVDPTSPRSVYDEGKRYAETVVATAAREGLDAGIVRIFNTYGPRMGLHDGRVVPTFVLQGLLGEPMTVAGDGSQTRSLCYVDDLVDGLVAMARRRVRGPVNLGSTDEVSVSEIADEVALLTGHDGSRTRVEAPEGDPRVRRPDTTRAEALLGWRARTPLRAGLALVVADVARRAGLPVPQDVAA